MLMVHKPANILNLYKLHIRGGSQSFSLFTNFANVMLGREHIMLLVGYNRTLQDIECVHCHAIKNKIKNRDIVDDK